MRSAEWRGGGPSAANRLIVALDVDSVASARRIVASLAGEVGFYKVGLELAYADGGLAFARDLVQSGARLFLDLKLHDIPTTVERAAKQVARMGATFLTIHAYPQTMRAAMNGTAGSGTMLLGVTAMTSYDDADLAEAGYADGVVALVGRRAGQAASLGIDGLILSPWEAAAVRAQVGDALLLVTPGVRPAGAASADQKRVMTPGQAIAAGADYLVVGRPVTQAADPKTAAIRIVDDMARAFADPTGRRSR